MLLYIALVFNEKHYKSIKKQLMKNYNSILLSLGIGLAVGGILGVLFAPDKGSETRKKIKQSGSKLTKTVSDKINVTKTNLDKMKEKYKMNVDGIDETGNEFI